MDLTPHLDGIRTGTGPLRRGGERGTPELPFRCNGWQPRRRMSGAWDHPASSDPNDRQRRDQRPALPACAMSDEPAQPQLSMITTLKFKELRRRFSFNRTWNFSRSNNLHLSSRFRLQRSIRRFVGCSFFTALLLCTHQEKRSSLKTLAVPLVA